jgi:hypothetical protein
LTVGHGERRRELRVAVQKGLVVGVLRLLVEVQQILVGDRRSISGAIGGSSATRPPVNAFALATARATPEVNTWIGSCSDAMVANSAGSRRSIRWAICCCSRTPRPGRLL